MACTVAASVQWEKPEVSDNNNLLSRLIHYFWKAFKAEFLQIPPPPLTLGYKSPASFVEITLSPTSKGVVVLLFYLKVQN